MLIYITVSLPKKRLYKETERGLQVTLLTALFSMLKLLVGM